VDPNPYRECGSGSRSKEIEQINLTYDQLPSLTSQSCGSGMYKPGSEFFHPGSKIFRIPAPDCIKECRVFLTPKTVSKLSGKLTGLFIPESDFFLLRIQQKNKHMIPYPYPDSKHCYLVYLSCKTLAKRLRIRNTD
jgi:hypothetical protein